MKRHVLATGPATLAVSLPAAWVKQQNLRKGNVVNVEAEGQTLLVSKDSVSRVVRKATLNVSGLEVQ